jgi:hypothetical protein
MDMKKVLFTLAFGFAFISCGTMYDTYDGTGYTNYTYGYTQEYVIYNNGYRYGYEAGVIDAITNRMVLAMALDQARAARLLELNRRYFYIFHSMPNFSFGYYNFNPGPPPPLHNPVGPGYYGGPNRPPYGGNYSNYTGRGQGGYRSNYDVNMTERDLQDAAKEYTRSVKSIVGNQNYTVFENRVRADAKQANQKVNAVRVNPNLNTERATTSSTRIRSNGNTTNTTPTTSGTRVRSNSNTTNTTPTTSGTRVRSNSNTTNTNTQQSTGSNTRTRVRTNNTSSSTNNTTTTSNTTTRTRTRTR